MDIIPRNGDFNSKRLSLIKKGIIVISIVFLAVLIPIIIKKPSTDEFILTDDQGKILFDVERIDSHPLYLMNFYSDYAFEDYLITGISYLNQEVLEIEWACTSFATLNNESDMLFGRNFDWSHNPALILFTDPIDGYKSISMVDLGLIGTNDDFQVSNNLQALLRAPYYVLDGMNEYGLTISCMAIDNAENMLDPEKVTLGSLDFIRLGLDYARNVEEVIDLWDNFNVYFPPGPDLHYLIADPCGNSAVIEWVDGEMKILRNVYLWQVSTNFVIYESSEIEQQNCIRYITCESFLSEKYGRIDKKDAFNLLEAVSQSITQWSAVYNMEKRKVSIIMGRNYNNPIHEFVL